MNNNALIPNKNTFTRNEVYNIIYDNTEYVDTKNRNLHIKNKNLYDIIEKLKEKYQSQDSLIDIVIKKNSKLNQNIKYLIQQNEKMTQIISDLKDKNKKNIKYNNLQNENLKNKIHQQKYLMGLLSKTINLEDIHNEKCPICLSDLKSKSPYFYKTTDKRLILLMENIIHNNIIRNINNEHTNDISNEETDNISNVEIYESQRTYDDDSNSILNNESEEDFDEIERQIKNKLHNCGYSELIVLTSCNHLFHKTCHDLLYKNYNDNCPCCRQKHIPIEIGYYENDIFHKLELSYFIGQFEQDDRDKYLTQIIMENCYQCSTLINNLSHNLENDKIKEILLHYENSILENDSQQNEILRPRPIPRPRPITRTRTRPITRSRSRPSESEDENIDDNIRRLDLTNLEDFSNTSYENRTDRTDRTDRINRVIRVNRVNRVNETNPTDINERTTLV